MSEHDETRRAFLKGAAVGVGAVAGAGLVPEALAAEAKAGHDHLAAPAAAAMAAGEHHGAFFNDEDAKTVAAFAERLMPSAPGKPGAKDADALNYIDLALMGPYADQQDFYRRGLAQLETYCMKAHGNSFRRLPGDKQDAVIAALEDGKADNFTYPSAKAFFDRLRTHTMEGMFSDPVYGGNKDFAGWRLVGFPGAQHSFSPADLKSREAFTSAPMQGLQSRAKTNMRRG
jgi:gluconate 2-dehydrogenase gamma chain